MRAVLSNRIYLDNVTPELQEYLDQELTYRIPRYRPDIPPEIIHNMRIIQKGIVSIPAGREDLIPEEYEVLDKRVLVPAKFPEFKFALRPDQQEIFNKVNDTCFINAPPSWGKTFSGLAIAGKLGQKTLVITHQVPLRRQWEKEIEKVFSITPGVVGGGEVINFDSPIVVSNIQTAVNNITLLARSFGTVILDEAHHLPATSFKKLLDTNYARYKIGLSASNKRKDGKHVLFPDYFSPNVFVAERNNAMDPSIHIIRVPIRFSDDSDLWANKVTGLCDNYEYRKYIAGISSAYAAKGHKVLVVGQRTSFLKACAEMAGPKAVAIVGKVPQEERDLLERKILSGEINQVFGTQSIFSEGISINPLSCLVLGNPINNNPLLEQLIGRIERVLPGKLDPIVIDVHLIGKNIRRQQSTRMSYYIQKGYEIKQI